MLAISAQTVFILLFLSCIKTTFAVPNRIQSLGDASEQKSNWSASNTSQRTTDHHIVAVGARPHPDNTFGSQWETVSENRRKRFQSHQKLTQSERKQIRETNEAHSLSENAHNAHGAAVDELKRRNRRALSSLSLHIWPSGIIPYEIGPQFSSYTRTLFLSAMRTWEKGTCLSFIEREPNHKSYINFTVKDCGCCARVGRQGDNQQQTISIAPKCENLRSVVHELGHVIGFWHEHSRPDRDAFIEIFTKNIKTKNVFNFEQKSYNEVNSLGEPYDYNSIMHYRTNAFAKADGLETIRPKHGSPRIGITSKPSKGDTKQVNMLYKCPSCGQNLFKNSGRFATPSGKNNPREQQSRITTHGPTPFSKRQSKLSNIRLDNLDPLFCSWRIIASSGERIQLSFKSVNLSQLETENPEQVQPCIDEYVEFRDGYYSGSPLIGRYCVSKLPSGLTSSSSKLLIKYTKSAGKVGSGFVATYQVVCGDSMKKGEGTFTSPGYPSYYPPQKDCTWRITVPIGFSVLLTFYSFDLEKKPNCSSDYLDILDGISISSPRLHKLCGAELPQPVRSTSNKMTVRFVTDAGVQKEGFTAGFQKVSYSKIGHCARTQQNCQQICVNIPGGYKCQCYDGNELFSDNISCKAIQCGGYLTKDEAFIITPNYPHNLTPNITCVWRIVLPIGFSVDLTFINFELDDQVDCLHNYVEVFDGSTESSIKSGYICGSNIPAPIMSTRNSMTLKFVSGADVNTVGFKARYEKVVSCGEYFVADEGNITSPNYPDNYPSNIKCIWRIEVPVGVSIFLTFSSFDLEDNDNCSFDYVQISDGFSASSPVLHNLCGSEKPTDVWSTTNTMTVKFVSDSLINGQGFIAGFKAGVPPKSRI